MKQIFFIGILAVAGFSLTAKAQDSAPQKSTEIYGFVMMDAGYNANQIDPNWFDVVRPSKLPSYKNEFGTDGNCYFGVRQTRLGIKSNFETSLGTLKTIFEVELFGTGVDAGQTTFRLRHAYAELGKFGVGQYWSPFMDVDVFPNTVEYWGPPGMVFFRNIQFRYMPIQGDTRLTLALERPGASGDGGVYADVAALSGIKSRFPAPDFSAEYRQALGVGYVELAGIARYIGWEDQLDDNEGYSGNVVGWGLNLSTNVKFLNSNIFRGQLVYGEGIENYMNDAPVDVAIDHNKAVALPVLGVVAFVDHEWSKKFTSSVGWSMIDISNTDGQSADSFHSGNYAIGNLLYYPVENAMMGVELQYGSRKNYNDGWDTDIFKVQFSFKYNFSQAFSK
jgi:hypothetical protein